MTEDPADGLDPEDIKELDRLFKEIVEQSGTQHEVFATDDGGLTDSVSVVVTPGTVEAQADVPEQELSSVLASRFPTGLLSCPLCRVCLTLVGRLHG
jgi:hypothetical protein